MANRVAFNAEEFVDFLLEEGNKVACDDTVECFNRAEQLPSYYDQKTYKRGQKFFYQHIFALFYGKLLGLMSVLAIPKVLAFLQYTEKSSSVLSAYKRYMATIFHMVVWYDDDFYPGSKLWASINDVKKKHNSASKRCSMAGLYRITQKDMALTQFGFMGFALARRELIGAHNIPDEDWLAFIHLWRVIGYAMGIEDRFNICRDSVQETTDICRVLIAKELRPAIAKRDPEFIKMTSYLLRGMWVMNPTFAPKLYLTLMWNILKNDNINNNAIAETYLNEPYLELNRYTKFLVYMVELVMKSLKFWIFRQYYNYVQIISLWLMRVCPFLAYYKFGFRNSYVRILPDLTKKTYPCFK